MFDDIPLYWDAWDVMDYHLQTRYLPSVADTLAASGCRPSKLTAQLNPTTQKAGARRAAASARGFLQRAPRRRQLLPEDQR